MKNIFISISIFIVVITNWHCSTQKLKETEIHNSERRVIEDMIFVEGGTFEMGSKDGESDEKPVHNVELDDFYISKYEVTQNEWQEVMGNNPSLFLGDYLPVEKVSWNDIQEFLQILNAKIGGNYRLPTEAEWEYAARGGNKYSDYKYSGSNNIDEVAWYDGNSGNKTHRVGIKKANGLGIYDMTGNVWEWCSDWYGENYYSESSSSNPQGPSNGTYRVLRGGSCV
ncbi:MAG: SUMF1/EgtB/PvdO family nonheme iron enzyme, partial [Ignavibacteriales bacterium]|nr:SUMF1/EgtB/PvdO family nonheme iron enzyme [Ignavibacteriales bacterium]